MNKDGSIPLRELRQRLQQAAAEFVTAQLEGGEPLSEWVRPQWKALSEAVWALAVREAEVYGPPEGGS